MRKFLLFILLNSYLKSEAQVIETGKRIIGGSIGFGYNSNKFDSILGNLPNYASKSGYINLSPSFGKALKNNLVLGGLISAGYNALESKSNNSDIIGKANGYNLGAGFFIERYFPISTKFSFSGSVPILYNHSRHINKTYSANNLFSTSTLKYNSIGLGVSPSFNYGINSKWLVQVSTGDFISIGYTKYKSTTEGSTITKHTQTGSNFGVHSSINNSRLLDNLSFSFRYIF
jgi:hypothetical protein